MTSMPTECPVPSCSRGPCRTAARLILAEAAEVPVGCPNRIEITDPAEQLPHLLSSTDLHTTPRADELISIRPGRGRRSNLIGPVTGGRLVLLQQRVRHPIREGGGGKRSIRETPDTPLMATVDEEQDELLDITPKAVPPSLPPKIGILTDDENAHAVGWMSPGATQVRFGLWDNAHFGGIRNNAAEASNFVGADTRRFYFAVFDLKAKGEISINWKTLLANRTDDDAPASQSLTLRETSFKLFVSKAVMLVTDDTDRNQVTNSGLPRGHADFGDRKYGESNHRTRRARLDGFVRGEYTPAAAGASAISVELPVFQRSPDERRRLTARVINYSIRGRPSSNEAYIKGQFTHANHRWNQVGLQIDRAPTVVRACPAAALNKSNLYFGKEDTPAGRAAEQAVLKDLIPITPDNTVTIVFVRLRGTSAYATIKPRRPIPQPGGAPALTLGNRFFVFLNNALNLNLEVLAHEFHHVIFNRFDCGGHMAPQFFVFNKKPAVSKKPDVASRRRIHNLYSPDPDNDPKNDNILNWYRRVRGKRYPVAVEGQFGTPNTATATTGNTLVRPF